MQRQEPDQPGPRRSGGFTRRDLLASLLTAGAAGVVSGSGVAVASGSATGQQGRFAAQQRALTTGAQGSLRVLWRAETDQPLVALTFDDGPSAQFTPQVLDILEQEQAPASFFVVAQQVRAHPELVRRAAAAGHDLGNHTATHANLGTLSPEQARAEIRICHDVLGDVTGRTPVLLRPPYGAVSGAALAEAERLGYDVALWSLALRERHLDAAGNVRRFAEQVRPGTIMLAHDQGGPERQIGCDALPGIIRTARRAGFRLVTLTELLAAETAVQRSAQR